VLDYYKITFKDGKPVVEVAQVDISGCTISWVAQLGKEKIQNLEDGHRLIFHTVVLSIKQNLNRGHAPRCQNGYKTIFEGRKREERQSECPARGLSCLVPFLLIREHHYHEFLSNEEQRREQYLG
jgi:hypothetical protein